MTPGTGCTTRVQWPPRFFSSARGLPGRACGNEPGGHFPSEVATWPALRCGPGPAAGPASARGSLDPSLAASRTGLAAGAGSAALTPGQDDAPGLPPGAGALRVRVGRARPAIYSVGGHRQLTPSDSLRVLPARPPWPTARAYGAFWQPLGCGSAAIGLGDSAGEADRLIPSPSRGAGPARSEKRRAIVVLVAGLPGSTFRRFADRFCLRNKSPLQRPAALNSRVSGTVSAWRAGHLAFFLVAAPALH